MIADNKVYHFALLRKLVVTQLHTVRQQLFDMVINLYVWAFCSLIIMGYIMQSFGLAADYGSFQLASIVGTVGLFEIYGNVTRNVMDFDGDRNISYYLTLPTTPAMVFGSFVCFYTLVGIFLSIIILPFGKLLLYNTFDVTNISFMKTALMIILSNVFFGVFTLVITSHVGTMSKMRNVWSRFIFPLWIMGGFQFSWAIVYKISAPLAYLMLCNPIVYVMEGFRAALLGQEGYLSWVICCGMLSLFIGAFWFYMLKRMKRLLDFV
ncbi:MAG TPA: hypothetical protein VGO09_01750 [Flavisolibacter sp.]|nr:hypothetical protein [Flavisolibacter sp.]